MNEYEYVYTKTRRELGAPRPFDSKSTILYENSVAESTMGQNYQYTNPVQLTVDNIPTLSRQVVNTKRIATETHSQSHTEGGWPKEVDPSDPQDTSKWRKRLDKDSQVHSTVNVLCREMKGVVDENNAIDMFGEYFAGESVEVEVYSLQSSTVALYKDASTSASKRGVSRISWNPDGTGKLAAAYSVSKFQNASTAEQADKSSYVWDMQNTNVPSFEILPSWPLVSLQYYSRNPELLIGGDHSGLVEYFDFRSGARPVGISSYEHSHSEPLFDVMWLQSKTHSECVSTSPDGKVLWWDTRNLSAPTDTCMLTDNGKLFSGTSLDWQLEAGPTKYLVGTEEGCAVSLTKRPKKPIELSGWFGLEERGGQHAHVGPIFSIKRNPFHSKYFLTVGDWGAKLWLEELRSPLYQTPPSGCLLTCGGWSPTRAGLFYTGRIDGVIDFYDYNYEMTKVAYSHKASEAPITACSIEQAGGRLMAVGDANGTVTIVQLCEELSSGPASEKTTIGSILEREQRRERNLDGLRKQQRSTTALAGAVPLRAPDAKTIDQQDYLGREKDWLSTIGLPENQWDLTVKAGLPVDD